MIMEEVLEKLKKINKTEYECIISFEIGRIRIKLKRGFDKYYTLQGMTIREFNSIEVNDRIFNFEWLDDKTLNSIREVMSERDFSNVEELIYNVFRDSSPCPICNNPMTRIIDEYKDVNASDNNYHIRKKCHECNHEWDANSIREN